MPQYGAVAMEHWGACSYGEPFLLYRHRVSTTFDREYIITLIMHEFVVSFKYFILSRLIN